MSSPESTFGSLPAGELAQRQYLHHKLTGIFPRANVQKLEEAVVRRWPQAGTMHELFYDTQVQREFSLLQQRPLGPGEDRQSAFRRFQLLLSSFYA